MFSAASVRADELGVFEACLHLSGVFDDAARVFSDDHNPDEKLDVLLRLHLDYRYLAPLVSTAGGDEAKSVLTTFGSEQPKMIAGNIFVLPISKDIAQCKDPLQDKHSCSPMFDLLSKTSAALGVACVNDYEKATN
jgi:hypothetical protein